MTLNLDAIAGVLCTFVAFAIFFLHIVTGPKRGHWITLPEYVRKGFFLTGASFLYRGVNLITLPPDKDIPGHINAEGLLALVVLTYTVSALAVWVLQKVYPEGFWSRIHAAEEVADRSGPWAAILFLNGWPVWQDGEPADELEKRL